MHSQGGRRKEARGKKYQPQLLYKLLLFNKILVLSNKVSSQHGKVFKYSTATQNSSHNVLLANVCKFDVMHCDLAVNHWIIGLKVLSCSGELTRSEVI